MGKFTAKYKQDRASYFIASALRFVRYAKLEFEDVIREVKPTYAAKSMINTWIRMLNRIETDVKSFMNNEEKELLEKELMNDDVAMQLQDIMNLIYALNPEQRDEVERDLEVIVDKNFDNDKKLLEISKS